MTDELRAAATKILDWIETTHNIDGEFDRIGSPFRRLLRDMCYAVLAEHPADEDEPLTQEWLRTASPTLCEGLERFSWHEGQVWVCGVFGRITNIASPKTRGQFRQLCKALGIELKENK